MTDKLHRKTAAVFIFLGIYINIPFSILASIFDYPDILRQPVGEVLTLFKQGGGTLIAVWYAFVLAALLMIIAVPLLHRVLKADNPNVSFVPMIFGILAGVFQVLGLIRWVFVVPVLANAYTDPAATEPVKAASVMVFQGFHQYAGVALGEHLGQLCTAIWLFLTSLALIRSSIAPKWLSGASLGISIMMFFGLAEGFATVVSIDALVFSFLTPAAFITMSIWMIVLGVILWMRKSEPEAVAQEP